MGPARESFLFEIVFCHLSKDPTCDSVRFINLSFIPVELNASLLFDTNNNPQYIINIIRDVSERKMLEENIEKLKKLALYMI